MCYVVTSLGYNNCESFHRKNRLDELKTRDVAETRIDVRLVAVALGSVIRVELNHEVVAILGGIVEPVTVLGVHDQIVFHFAVLDGVLVGLDYILLLNIVGTWREGARFAVELLEIWHAEGCGAWAFVSCRVGTCGLDTGKDGGRIHFG